MRDKTNQNVTIKDVAREAGVSFTTVSYVLNNTKPVKPETRERVLEAVQRLHYHRNLVARNLKIRQSQTIGIMVPGISNSFNVEVIRGIEEYAYMNNYSVIICNTNEDEKRERRYFELLRDKGVDGLIYIGTGSKTISSSSAAWIPVVEIDRRVKDDVSMVLSDNVQGGYDAASFLLEKRGYPLYFLTVPITISTFFDRMRGFVRALEEKGFFYHQNLVYQCDHCITINELLKAGYQLMKQCISDHKEINSVFAGNDILAAGAMRALHEEGFVIGKDVFVCGYDDIDIASLLMPALTTMRQPMYEMGSKAASMLIGYISSGKYEKETIMLENQLIVRETAF